MNYQIIVAAGSGSRYGGSLPKQFCELNGRPLLMTTIERLHDCDPESELLVVVSGNMIGTWRDMCIDHSFTTPHTIISGGASRALSVRNAVAHIAGLPGPKGRIGVHDAARPVVTRRLIENLVDRLADGADGVIPACRVTDSIRRINADGSSATADRSCLRAVQTPQLFPAGKLIDAYNRMLPVGCDNGTSAGKFTDDASVMEAAGFTDIRLTEGDPRNIKVTNPGDMAVAELYLSTAG